LISQDLPQPSPSASVMQRVGMTDITIEYSRPGVKDRTIWGALVPYDEVWRTGANKANQLTFSTDVTINSTSVPAGTYALFSIPGKEEWTIIINKKAAQWGDSEYKGEDDIVQIKVKPQEAPFTERMLFTFDNVKDDATDITLTWEKLSVTFSVGVNSKEMAKKSIDESIAEAERAFRAYNSAARYYAENDGDMKKALEWATKSVEMDKRFWNVYTLSMAQAGNGMYAEAIKTAEESLKMSQEEDYQRYIDLNTENLEKWRKKM